MTKLNKAISSNTRTPPNPNELGKPRFRRWVRCIFCGYKMYEPYDEVRIGEKLKPICPKCIFERRNNSGK